MNWDKIKEAREFLKDIDRDIIDFNETDQSQQIPAPPIEKPWEGGELIDLPGRETFDFPTMSVMEAIEKRASRRVFDLTDMKLTELAYLLWATTGVRSHKPYRTLRMAPSAGNRHSEETYLAVMRVEGLKPGIYRYLPLEHKLGLVRAYDDIYDRVHRAARMQLFATRCNILFIWTTIPYRTEWRYDYASAKVIAMDLGHLCQNLYLACESIGYGTCAVGAYDQAESDQLVEVDGEDEFTIYMAPVGRQKLTEE